MVNEDAALILARESLTVLFTMDGVAEMVGANVGKSNVSASTDDPGQHCDE